MSTMLVVLRGVGAAELQRYDNEEFGFSVALPVSLSVCTDVAPAPNRGIVVLLQLKASCMQSTSVRKIRIFGEYNVAGYDIWTRWANEKCRATPRQSHAEILRLNQLVGTECVVRKDPGVIVHKLFVQRKTVADKEQWINLEVWVETTSAYEKRDLQSRETILRALELKQPGKH